MDDAIAAWLETERTRVESRIRSAFAGVSRAGGVSWTQSMVLDGYGDHRDAIDARAADTESSWEALVDDATWRPDCGVGGFNFLDPIGTRYYIAHAMIRATHGAETANISFALYFDPPPDANDFRERKFALLDSKQRRAIHSFLVFMILLDTVRGYESGQCDWIDCLAHHWGQFGE